MRTEKGGHVGMRARIRHASGEEEWEAEFPDDVPLRRLMPVLASKLGSPIIDSAGRAVTYHLYHADREIGLDETLASAGVADGDTMELIGETVAGGGSARLLEVQRLLQQLTSGLVGLLAEAEGDRHAIVKMLGRVEAAQQRQEALLDTLSKEVRDARELVTIAIENLSARLEHEILSNDDRDAAEAEFSSWLSSEFRGMRGIVDAINKNYDSMLTRADMVLEGSSHGN